MRTSRKHVQVVIMTSSDKALMLFRRFLVLGIFLCWGIAAAHAQGEIPDVHIQPRVHSSARQSLRNGYVDMIRKRVALVELKIPFVYAYYNALDLVGDICWHEYY